MRYNLMLQVVGLITVILVGTAALFAWVQNRPPAETEPTALQLHNSQRTYKLLRILFRDKENSSI